MNRAASRARVAIVTRFFDDQPGFMDFRYRVEALNRTYDVTLVLRDECFKNEFAFPGLRTKVLHERRCGTRALLRYIRRASRALRADRFDAVLLLGAQLAPASLLLRGVPSVLYWNEHPTHTFNGKGRGIASVALARALVGLSYEGARRASVVMPIGEDHHDDLLRHGVKARRLRLVPMGVHERFAHTALSRPPRREDESLYLVYTGTVQRERGRDVMLEGLALARRQGAACRLTLVGASEAERLYCLKRGIELGISGALTVVGRVPGDAIPGYLRQADVGICIWEDQVWWRFNPPTKLFEYLAAGLPVLASRIRTHTRYVADGVNGIVFDYADQSFCDALLRLCAMRGELPQLSAAAASSGEKFLWPRIENHFLHAVTESITR